MTARPAAAAAPAGEARIALVIGNGAYKDSPLLNPVNDAKAVSAALRDAGFEVIERHDQGAVEMRRAIREFGEKLRGKGAGLFYFAGHGVQVNGRNFLIPANADIKYEDEIEDQSVDVALVLNKMESAKARINLVVLDACRNNPFVRGSRSAQSGLAAMEAPIGSLIAYATSPGQVASDGRGRTASTRSTSCARSSGRASRSRTSSSGCARRCGRPRTAARCRGRTRPSRAISTSAPPSAPSPG